MSVDEKKVVEEKTSTNASVDTVDEDDAELVALGYKPSFKREFTNLATVSPCLSFLNSRGGAYRVV